MMKFFLLLLCIMGSLTLGEEAKGDSLGISSTEYEYVQKCIENRVFDLKHRYTSMKDLTSLKYYEYNVRRVKVPVEKGKKMSGTKRVYSDGGYFFSLSFHNKPPQTAKMYLPIHFGNLMLIMDMGYSRDRIPTEIIEINRIVREEQEAFYLKHKLGEIPIW